MPHILDDLEEKVDCVKGKLDALYSLTAEADALVHGSTISQQEAQELEEAAGRGYTVVSNICAGEALSSGQSLDGCINEIQAKMPQ
jgi:hypothetical protein